MLSEDIKYHLNKVVMDFREDLLILPKVCPKEIVSTLIEQLAETGKELEIEHLSLEHIKNLNENREEAEQLVAGILGMR